jgi:putative flippase GtrA
MQRPTRARWAPVDPTPPVPHPADTAPGAPKIPAVRRLASELVPFGLVGLLGTVITIAGANLMRHWLDGGPVTSVVVPTMVSTVTSYLLNRHWTFRHRGGEGYGRGFVIFFGLNGVGTGIQALCTGFTFYTLGLHSGVAYNAGLLAGLGLASAFRYWSYKKWVFTPVTA